MANLAVHNSPGVYIAEDTYGAIPTALANHSAVYVLGTCSSTDFPVNTPVYIGNYVDFLTKAISSPSSAAVKLFFSQRSGCGLYFIKVAPRQQVTLSASDFSLGKVLSVSIGGAVIKYTCVAQETATTALDSLGGLIMLQLAGVVTYYRDAVSAYLRYPVGSTLAVSTGLTLGVATTGTYPKAYDVDDAIDAAFVPELEQGYVCAPEFFQAFLGQSDRYILQSSLEALASDPNYYWVAVSDFGQAVATSNYVVNDALTERAGFISTRGNSWCSFPYVVDTYDNLVPSSLVTIGIALRRARAEGFQQPPAGVSYPVYDVKRLSVNITRDMQEQLNPKGINCFRSLPGRGIVAYGARTLSTNPYYKFASTRVILNVLAGTLRNAFDSVVFTLVDGQGVLFSRVRQTANNVCEILRLGGALFGATPQDAYLCICDLTNNSLLSLETGEINLDVIVKPSPTLEVLNITLSRSSLSATLIAVVASGNPTGIPTTK